MTPRRILVAIAAVLALALPATAAATPLTARLTFRVNRPETVTAQMTSTPAGRVLTGTWRVTCHAYAHGHRRVEVTHGRYHARSGQAHRLRLPTDAVTGPCLVRFAASMPGYGHIHARLSYHAYRFPHEP